MEGFKSEFCTVLWCLRSFWLVVVSAKPALSWKSDDLLRKTFKTLCGVRSTIRGLRPNQFGIDSHTNVLKHTHPRMSTFWTLCHSYLVYPQTKFDIEYRDPLVTSPTLLLACQRASTCSDILFWNSFKPLKLNFLSSSQIFRKSSLCILADLSCMCTASPTEDLKYIYTEHKPVMEKIIHTPRLTLYLLETSAEGSRDLKEMHIIRSSPGATIWRWAWNWPHTFA